MNSFPGCKISCKHEKEDGAAEGFFVTRQMFLEAWTISGGVNDLFKHTVN